MTLTSDRLTSPGVHDVMLTVLILVHMGAMLPAVSDATSAADVLEVSATSLPCAHPDALEASRAMVLQRSSCRSPLDCVTSCLRHSMCSAVAHVQQNEVTSAPSSSSSSSSSSPSFASCVLLGGINQTPATLSGDDPEKETCTLHILFPCPKGSSVFRGYCRCPEGTTGQFCQLANPDDCSASWNRVYSSSGSPNNKSDVIQANKNLGATAKVALDYGDGSILILQGMHFFYSKEDSLASQVTPTLSRQTWDRLDDFPALQFRFADSAGKVQSFSETSNAKDHKVIQADWFIRQPLENRLLYAYNSAGLATSGSVHDVIEAVRNGLDIVTFNAAHVQSAVSTVQLNRYHWEISRSGYNFPTIPYWINSLCATDGAASVYRYYIVGDSLVPNNPQQFAAGKELYVDVCWTPAHTDLRSSNNNNHRIGYLVAAVLNGQSARVVVDDHLALTVDQVLVLQTDRVLFGARVFMDPGVSGFTPSSEEIRMVVSTDGELFQCQNLPPAGSLVTETTSSAHDVNWFVSTRHGDRVYSVTSEGVVTHGTEEGLYSAVEQGASLTLGLTFSSPAGHFWLLTTRTVELRDGEHVVVMAEGLSRLPIPKGPVTSPLECGLRAVLLTSQGKVSIYDYKHKEQGTHDLLTDVTVDWFVDLHVGI